MISRASILFPIFFAAFFVTSCSHKKISSDIATVQSKLKTHAESVRTVVGRIHITGKIGSESFSLPADIAIGLQDVSRFRLAGNGPVGTTPLLMILNGDVLKIYDFQNRTKDEIKGYWNGIPVKWLSPLFVGIVPNVGSAKFKSMEDDVVTVSVQDGTETTEMNYVLKPTDDDKSIVVSMIKASYEVKFSEFSTEKENYLPKETEIKGKDLYLRINWLERQINKEVKPELFLNPKVGF